MKGVARGTERGDLAAAAEESRRALVRLARDRDVSAFVAQEFREAQHRHKRPLRAPDPPREPRHAGPENAHSSNGAKPRAQEHR